MSAQELFGNSGQQEGLEIWRIEQMAPVRWPEEQYGHFYSGDSYICLHTRLTPDGKYEWNIHFWLGNESSQDEQGAAAILTVELDDVLGGAPAQHREVQGHESPMFVSYFKSGVMVMEGGVDSAFNHVDPDSYTPRLFHVKGKRNVRVSQTELSHRSMNKGDVFILDAGLKLYQWNGPQANKYEKFKALEMITNINNNERGGRGETFFMEGEINDNEPEFADFWTILGGSGPIMSAEEAGGDDEELKRGDVELFQISDASGRLKIDSLGKGPFEKSMLSPDEVYLLDTGAEVFVWIGKGATKNEKTSAMQHATDYLKKKNRPNWCPVTRLVQFAETPVFKSYFPDFDPPRTVDFGAPKKKVKEAKSDVSALYGGGVGEEKQTMVDDGSGTLTIWRVENLQLQAIPKGQYGEFFGGDSYVILYEYEVRDKPFQILYFWQGRDSSQDEKAASALLTVQMDDELTAQGKQPTQVRVVQGKEPNHFLCLFKGKMIVHSGGIASAFKNRNDQDSYDTDGVALYHIKGTSELNTRAIQVEEKALSLNSGDVFVLLNPTTEFIWYGVGANAEEKSIGKAIADRLQGERSQVEFTEGHETDEFWETLGGQTDYPRSKTLEASSHAARLFCLSNVTGDFVVEEVFNFTQDDLSNDDVFLLDTFNEVYVYVGSESNRSEKEMAFQTAIDFVKNAPDGRDKDTPILKVEPGREPPMFTCHFFGWKDLPTSGDPYLEKLKALKGEAHIMQITSALDAMNFRPTTEKFSYDDLKFKRVDKIDPMKRHEYLSDEDFRTVFGVTLAEFNRFPAWKQKQQKQAKKLF